MITDPKELNEKYIKLFDYSNPDEAQKKAVQWLGLGAVLYPSTKEDKKYMVFDPYNQKWVHFGQMLYEDYLKHNDIARRRKFRLRAQAMRGKWRDNIYSANNLSLNILW